MTQIDIESGLGTVSMSSAGITDEAGVQWYLITHTGLFDGPPVRTNYVARPLGWGQYDGPVYPDKRVITVKASVVAPNEQAYAQAIRYVRGFLGDGSLGKLTISDAAGPLFAPVKRTDVTQLSMVGSNGFDASFQFSAADPRLLGDYQTQTTGMAQSSGVGLPWRGSDGTGGVEFRNGMQWRGVDGGNPISGAMLLDNRNGTAEADIEFTIRGPALNPSIRTSTSRITYGGSLGEGDTLVINTGSGSVLLNGGNRRPYLTSAQWFNVPAGAVQNVTFSAEIQNSTASCTATFNASYL